MSLDRIIRPSLLPDIFPAKSTTTVNASNAAAPGNVSLTIGGKNPQMHTVTLNNSLRQTVYTVKRPTEK